MQAAVQFVHEQLTAKRELPSFKAGDNITVNYKIVEGGKERIQSFRGDVIKLQGVGAVSYTHLDVYKRQAWLQVAVAVFVPLYAGLAPAG